MLPGLVLAIPGGLLSQWFGERRFVILGLKEPMRNLLEAPAGVRQVDFDPGDLLGVDESVNERW